MAPNKFGGALQIILNFIRNKTVAVVHRGGRQNKKKKNCCKTDSAIVKEVKKFPFKGATQLVKKLCLTICSRMMLINAVTNPRQNRLLANVIN